MKRPRPNGSSRGSGFGSNGKKQPRVFFADALPALRQAGVLAEPADPPLNPLKPPADDPFEAETAAFYSDGNSLQFDDESDAAPGGETENGLRGDSERDGVAESQSPNPEAPTSEAPTSDIAEFSATERMVSGSVWGIASVVWSQLWFALKSVLLARLLSRDAFGLFGMSMTVQGALEAFTYFGLNTTIVSKKFEDDAELQGQLNTIWTLDLIRRALVTAVIMAFSFQIAKFYRDERLTSILAITCLTLAVSGFGNIGMSLLGREVKWKQATLYNMASTTLMTGSLIAVAFWRRDAWSLAWGQLVASVLSTALSYAFHPYRPRFQIDRRALNRSSKTGLWFFVLAVADYSMTTLDNVVIGRLLGSALLGVYIVAYGISSIPRSMMLKAVSTVMFPVVAALNRNEDARLGPAIARVMNIATSVLPMMIVPMAVLAPEIIGVFYGAKWQDAVDPLRILLLSGLLRALLQVISPIIIGLDRPDIEARSTIAEVVVFALALWLLVPPHGLVGAAWASVATYLVAVLLRFRNVSHLVPNGFNDVPLQMLTMSAASVFGAGAGLLLVWALGAQAPVVRLGVGTLVIWLATGAALLLLRPQLRAEVGRVQNKIRGRRRPSAG